MESTQRSQNGEVRDSPREAHDAVYALKQVIRVMIKSKRVFTL